MDKLIIEDLVNGLKDIFTDRLISIILYGSFARGTNSSDSDVDIAIILKDAKINPIPERFIHFTVDLDLKYDKFFSIIDIDYGEFLKWQDVLPFYKNVKKDGVILWKIA